MVPATSFPCVYCGSTDNTPLYPTRDIFGDDWMINWCRSCSARILSPPPTSEQLSNAYAPDYYGKGPGKFGTGMEKVLDCFRKKRAKRLHQFLGLSSKVLDVGCGNGRFLYFMQQLGHQIYGVEMPGGSANRAKEITGLTLKLGHLRIGDFEPNTFDAITLHHVFEHLTEPKKCLDIICDILKPGGYLVMSFPNIDSFQSHLFKGNWFHLDPPRHLFFFAPDDFKRQIAVYGLEVIKEKHFSIEYNPFGWQQSILNYLSDRRDVLYEHIKRNEIYTRDYSSTKLSFQSLFHKVSVPMFIALDMGESILKKGGTVEFILKLNGINTVELVDRSENPSL